MWGSTRELKAELKALEARTIEMEKRIIAANAKWWNHISRLNDEVFPAEICDSCGHETPNGNL